MMSVFSDNGTRGAMLAVAGVLAFAPPTLAQPLDGPPADPRFRYSTAMPDGVAAPDAVETRLGTLRFTYGYPDAATARAV
jgi:hypothetical protein